MTDLYIIRHGKTLWNAEVRMQGRLNSPLTPEGIDGALKLREKMEDIDIDKILVSPMPRALQTSYLATGGKLPIEIEPLLTEMDLGDLEGMKRVDFEKADPINHNYFRHEPEKFVPVGNGESYFDVVDRVKVLLLKLIKNNKDQSLLLVSHMILVQAILCIVTGKGVKELRSTPFIEQAKLVRIKIDKISDRRYKADILMYNGEITDEHYEFEI